MKIALIDPSCFTWPYDSALVQGLRDNGHDVTLYTKHLAAGDRGKGVPYVRELFYPGMQTDFIKALPRPLFLAIKGVSHFVGLLWLWVVLWWQKPDAIHFQWAPLPVIDRLFIRAFARIAPVVLTVHDSSPFNNNPSARLQRVGAIAIMKLFDRLIVHTEQAKRRLLEYGVEPARLALIPHGVLGEAAPKTQETVSGETLRTRRPLTLLLFGQLKPYKGADVLIRALAALPPDVRQQCVARVVGRAYMDTAPLVELARALNVEEQVVWDLRFVPEAELPEIFAATDVTLMPYREIDASGVLMLALAVGRPIVASRIGLFSELLEDGTHGYLVSQDNPEELAVALAKLATDDALRVRMGQNVRALAEAIPSWQEIGTRTTALYADARGRARA